jgi:radical SAM superfamily enzyme YgiQ (UPF0313 family)
VSGLPRPARVVLLGLNSQYVHSSLAPWCLKAGLREYARAPFEARVVEGTVNEPMEAVAGRVIDAAPDILSISCYIWNIVYVQRLLPLLRAALPGCVFVLGGPEVSFCAAEVLARVPEADYVLCGEGEFPFARLVDALSGIGLAEAVPGLCFRIPGGLELHAPFQHPEMQPSPYDEEYLRGLDGRIAYLETSRGCPYACAFCLSGRDEDRLRRAPIERAFEEILLLANSGSRTIKLVDRTFNADRRRALKILRFIAGEYGGRIPRGVSFHFEVAGDLLDGPALELVAGAPAGLFQFEIGLQSMDERALRLARRKTDMAHLTRQVSRLIACGRAHVHLDLIAGLPGEGLAEFARGFDAAYALRPHTLQLGFLKLLHGSAMREDPDTYPCRFDENPPYEVRETPWLSAADLQTLKLAERALDKLHNSGRFVCTLRWLTTAGGHTPFALFLALGETIARAEKGGGSLSLDALTDLVAEHLFARHPDKAALLKDLLLRDRLASVKTTLLPASLKRRDARYHAIKRALEKRFPRQENTPRAIGLLYAGEEDQVVFCDYLQPDPVTGLYDLQVMPVAQLLASRE